MGKSSAPTPPPPPSAKETAAANVDTAIATSQLQRAMQFGDEVMKDGYIREKLGTPEGATPVYTTTKVKSSIPIRLYDTYRGADNQPRLYVGEDGKILDKGQWGKDYAGMQWDEAVKKHNDAAVKSGIPNRWGHSSEGNKQSGTQYGTQDVKSLSGYRNADGKITQANRYFKISEDGTRSEVERHEALQADFTE